MTQERRFAMTASSAPAKITSAHHIPLLGPGPYCGRSEPRRESRPAAESQALQLNLVFGARGAVTSSPTHQGREILGTSTFFAAIRAKACSEL